MDGRVLTELFSQAYLQAHPVRMGLEPARDEGAREGNGLSDVEEAAVVEQLKKLGYL